MKAVLVAAVALVLGACVLALREDRAQPATTTATTKVIVIADDGSTGEALQVVNPDELAGRYRCGDGRGYNLLLTLRRSGQFEGVWSGCLGVYGKSSGAWTVDRKGLRLVSRGAEGILSEWLDRLFVIRLGTDCLLLPQRHRAWFEEYGPDHRVCLHKEGARDRVQAAWEAIADDWKRRAREAISLLNPREIR